MERDVGIESEKVARTLLAAFHACGNIVPNVKSECPERSPVGLRELQLVEVHEVHVSIVCELDCCDEILLAAGDDRKLKPDAHSEPLRESGRIRVGRPRP